MRYTRLNKDRLSLFSGFLYICLCILACGPGYNADSKALFKEFFRVYDIEDLNFEAKTAAEGALFRKAKMAYEKGQYQDAIRYFQALENEQPESEDLSFLIAVAGLAGAPEEPVEERLKLLSTQGELSLRQEASWYLALAQIRKEDFKAANRTLKRIKEGDYHWGVARRLLREM